MNEEQRFSRIFKALKMHSQNSRVFKGFQDVYEPWKYECSDEESTAGSDLGSDTEASGRYWCYINTFLN